MTVGEESACALASHGAWSLGVGRLASLFWPRFEPSGGRWAKVGWSARCG